MKKTIYLIRHCKAEGQDPGAELTPEGVEQSEALSRFLWNKNIDMIVSSPFVRAIQTIKPFVEQTDVMIRTDARLSERVLSSVNIPDWMAWLEKSYSDFNMKLHGGESSAEASQRGIEVINECVHNNAAGNIAIVTHGNLMSLMIRNYDKNFGFREWQTMSNPDVFELSTEGDNYSIQRIPSIG